MSGLKTGPATAGLQVFAIPAVCILIAFLGYFSQWLFNNAPDLAPGALTQRQTVVFNTLLVCVWYTYYKACTVNPGRYPALAYDSEPSPPQSASAAMKASAATKTTPRWCKKCRAPKPLRAHHCRHCNRCIPKMDHHCPWTGNCVSMQTFPYFIRFLFWTNMALWYLGYFVFQRMSGIWSDRHLPAYLGPSLTQLVSLTIISLVDAATSIALSILFFTTIRGWVLNSTMIEDWEVERHEAVLGRLEGDSDSSARNGDFWGADGDSGVLLAHLSRIEFPYDLGIFSNMAQAMGTFNPLLWFFPFSGGPLINTKTPGKGAGWEWEENGFNDLPGMWPPPDPEKLRRAQSGWPGAASRVGTDDAYYANNSETTEDVKAAFARRQLADVQRRKQLFRAQAQQSGIIAELEEMDVPDGGQRPNYEWEGPRAWTNAEGDTLWDYGVDEEIEQDDGAQYVVPLEDEDDDVPIAELIRRRRVLTKEQDE
ncbi:hypothetical protein OQA88_3988 [Cercophora sp. LCS_1]